MVSFLAYFTDPMGDEFKKAIEEALKEMEDEEKSSKKIKRKTEASVRVAKRKKKDPMNKLSRSTKKSLK
jgi:hypothetical protein